MLHCLRLQCVPIFLRLLEAAARMVRECPCTAPKGCPSCVQALECGSYNTVLDKAGALVVLEHVLAAEQQRAKAAGGGGGCGLQEEKQAAAGAKSKPGGGAGGAGGVQRTEAGVAAAAHVGGCAGCACHVHMHGAGR